jgi:Holliday junction resolvase
VRDKPLVGVDYISLCPEEIRLIEVKTTSSQSSKIYIQPVEWNALCAQKIERIYPLIDIVGLAQRYRKQHIPIRSRPPE